MKRSEAKFTQTKYFVNNFPALAYTPDEMDTLREEFDDYKDDVDLASCLLDAFSHQHLNVVPVFAISLEQHPFHSSFLSKLQAY